MSSVDAINHSIAASWDALAILIGEPSTLKAQALDPMDPKAHCLRRAMRVFRGMLGGGGGKGSRSNGGGGGAEILPRLVLSYYVIAAAMLAVVLGVLWFAFRSRNAGKVLRQLFLAPISYVAAHLLIKGFSGLSFFPEEDLVSIFVLAAAIYALLSLAWQVWMLHRQEK